MKKRNTLTISRQFFEITKGLKPEIKHAVQDAIFDLFFDNVPINYDALDESTKVALCCLLPDLRKMQQKFDAGITQKNYIECQRGYSVHLDEANRSVLNRNEAQGSAGDSSILNNNIYNNIYNTSINQSSQSIKSDAGKRKFYTEVLEEHLKTIEELEPQTHKRALNLVKQLGEQTSAFTIHNQQIMPEDILERYVDIFRTTNIAQILARLQNVFAGVDGASGVKNKFKYTVAAMFSEASGL